MQFFLCTHLPVLDLRDHTAGAPSKANPDSYREAGKPKHCFKTGIVSRKILLTMKLTAIILFAACIQVSAKGYSQKITLSVKDAPLEQVFTSIERQSGYSFNYNYQLIKKSRPVTIRVKDATLEEVLAICFKEQPFSYKIINQLIIIKEKEQANTGLLQDASFFSDPITVSGKVTDEEGRPLSGANVKVHGTNIGVTTDNNGHFTLKNVPENAVLEISFVGHEMKTFTVRGTGFVNIALGQKLSMLDETVVIAYGQTTRRFATGNIATVKAADIEKQPVQNPLLALQGRVPGIEITQLSGMNGGGVRVRIQGRNTIRNGQEPLVVIDGVPYPTVLQLTNLEDIVQGGSPLNYIDPAEIESIDVLKDADATAIYGSRAANGAILITTKKGKVGPTRLGINVQQGFGKVTRKADMMNTRQYLDMRYEAFKNDGRIPSANPGAMAPYMYAPDLTIWDTTRNTDWQKELIGGTAQYTNIGLSITGGTAAVQYRIGASFNRQTTVFPGNTENKSGNLHFSINGASVNQKFKIQLSGSYQINDNGLPGEDLTLKAIQMEPNAPALYNTDGSLNWAPNAAGSSTWRNPLIYTLYKDFNSTTKNLVSNAVLSYTIVPGLEMRSSFGYTNLQSGVFLSRGLNFLPPEWRALAGAAGRSANYADRKMDNWIVEPQLIFRKNFNKHNVDFLAGSAIQQNSSAVLSVTGSGFNSDAAMRNIATATSVTLNSSGVPSFYKYAALFGRLNYRWNEKLIVNVTARRDGSSRFGDKNKFHNFWSAGLGWIFTEEKWLQQRLPFLSFGKLRGSYGITGNDQIGDYQYLNLYFTSTTPINYQNSSLLSVNRINNPYYQWEETRKLQVGIDLGFFYDRVLFSLTYAHNRSGNQIMAYILPTITGFTSVIRNFPATIQNTSCELMLNTTNIKGRSFTWTSSINLTIPRNKLVRFPNIENTTYASGNSNVIIGQPLGIIKTYHYGGVDPATGNYHVLDKGGNPTMKPNRTQDLTAFINSLSRYYGGFQNSITYKRFKVDFLFQFVRRTGLNDLYYFNGSTIPGHFFSSASNQPVTLLNRWQKPGDNAEFARYTVLAGNNLLSNVSNANYTTNISFIRLKNVSASWQLPAVWLKRAGMQNGSLYFRGQNLATIAPGYHGLDPETQSFRSLPPLQLWTIGVQLGF